MTTPSKPKSNGVGTWTVPDDGFPTYTGPLCEAQAFGRHPPGCKYVPEYRGEFLTGSSHVRGLLCSHCARLYDDRNLLTRCWRLN